LTFKKRRPPVRFKLLVPEESDANESERRDTVYGDWRLGPGVRVSTADLTEDSVALLRRLLLAEDAMFSVAEAARAWLDEPTMLSESRRARLVAATGLAVMFARPFLKDDQGKRLRREDWRPADQHGDLFDRLLDRRNVVLAHVDTSAGHLNVLDVAHFGGPDWASILDLRVFDVGAADDLLEPETLAAIADLADSLARRFREKITEFEVSDDA